MQIKTLFTRNTNNPFKLFNFKKYDYSLYHQKTYELISKLENAEVVDTWTNIGNDTIIGKYFRKKGVPQFVDEKGNRVTALDENAIPLLENGKQVLGGEHSVKQAIHRLAYTWSYWAEKNGYLDKENAKHFYNELVYLLLDQRFSPNSPQWFNTGLHAVYGIEGKAQGHYHYDEEKKAIVKAKNAYERPQVHACFIQSINDDLVNEGGIMDLFVREARLFKYGSGTGTNFSSLRGEGEQLSGGGTSSGVISFLTIGDSAAGSIKSGGTTRRAAKMVILNIDHPDIEQFIMWKRNEELKAKDLMKLGYSNGIDGEAYKTVSGQNSNNSVRISDDFMKALIEDKEWDLVARTTNKPIKTLKAKALWDLIGQAAYECADPGIQFDTIINEWHTSPMGSDGQYNAPHNRINGSNPCSEYMFLDETACNLASINLLKFYNPLTNTFDVEGYIHTCRIVQLVLEISVAMAGYPSKVIAERSHLFRTTGIGYANIGALLMTMGVAYDSDEGRNTAGALTAIMTGTAYATSAEIASVLGAFEAYDLNKEHMLRVIRNHRRVAYDSPFEEFEGLSKKPMTIKKSEGCPQYLLETARTSWDLALHLGEIHGYRNAQVSVIAPTGTIGMQMDCDTTGPEPMFSLVSFKTLIGGGLIKIVNKAVPTALKTIGYSEKQINDIEKYFLGHQDLENAPHINTKKLIELGFTQNEINTIKQNLPSAMNITQIFKRPDVLTAHIASKFKLSEEDLNNPSFNPIVALGFSKQAIKEADIYLCGTLTLEGAPHLKVSHYAIFDSANKSGKYGIGTRYIHYMGHIKMMAYMQPFLSGAISKTINFPNEATVEEIKDSYLEAWNLSLKALAIYRDGSKGAQPLNTADKEEEEEKKDDKVKVVVENKHPLDELGRPVPQLIRLDFYNEGLNEPVIIGGKQIHIRTGEYPNGDVAELWVTVDNDEILNGHISRFTKQVSKTLQYGIPLEAIASSHKGSKSDPSGYTNHKYIKFCTSIYDFIMKLLLLHYKGDTSFIPEELRKNIKPIELRYFRNIIHKQIEASYQNVSFEDLDKGVSVEINEAEVSENKTLALSISNDADELEDLTSGPSCNNCGGDTKRNGSCYVCTVCGQTTGCS